MATQTEDSMAIKIDYIIDDSTNAYWPGELSYRHSGSARGYKTEDEARARMARCNVYYNGRYGTSPGSLRVLRRERTADGKRYLSEPGQALCAGQPPEPCSSY